MRKFVNYNLVELLFESLEQLENKSPEECLKEEAYPSNTNKIF